MTLSLGPISVNTILAACLTVYNMIAAITSQRKSSDKREESLDTVKKHKFPLIE
jgi:hypothetical protein